MIFISVVRNEKMYHDFVTHNPYNKGGEFIAYDNNQENIAIPLCYNHFLDTYDYSKPDWFIFCHEDWQAKQNWLPTVQTLDKKSIYGTFGTKLKIRGNKAKKFYIGQIEASHKDGSCHAVIGKNVPVGTKVETFDCMCLIIHSSLVQKHHIRFDEKLDWHHYAEELCIPGVSPLPLVCILNTQSVSGSPSRCFSLATDPPPLSSPLGQASQATTELAPAVRCIPLHSGPESARHCSGSLIRPALFVSP